MKLGEKIARYREENGLSMRAFSRLSGLSTTYISYLEKGVTQRGIPPVPTINTYQACAKAMNMDVDELVREVSDVVAINTNENELSPTKKKLIKEISSMEDEQLDKLLKLIEIVKGM